MIVRETDSLIALSESIIEQIIPPLPLDLENVLQISPAYIKKSFVNAPLSIFSHTEGALFRRRSQDLRAKIPLLRVQSSPETLPFKENSFDCVLSLFTLTFTDNLFLLLNQIQTLLNNKGILVLLLFTATPGQKDTLSELKEVLSTVDEEFYGGFPLRFIPLIRAHDVHAIFKKEKFIEPVVVHYKMTFLYSRVIDLLRDIKRLGFSCPSHLRSIYSIEKPMLEKIEKTYADRFDSSGRLEVTVNISVGIGFSAKN